MAQVFASTIAINYQVNETLALGFASASINDQSQPSVAWASGSASGCADLHWEAKSVTLSSGAATTFTLSSLADSQARAVALAKVTGIMVAATTRASGDYLTLGSAASNPWTNGPWGSGTKKCFDIYADCASGSDGWTVSSGSNDQLKILNSGSSSLVFNIGLIGRSV